MIICVTRDIDIDFRGIKFSSVMIPKNKWPVVALLSLTVIVTLIVLVISKFDFGSTIGRSMFVFFWCSR